MTQKIRLENDYEPNEKCWLILYRFQSQQTNNTLIMMANEIHFNIDSSEHVEKV